MEDNTKSQEVPDSAAEHSDGEAEKTDKEGGYSTEASGHESGADELDNTTIFVRRRSRTKSTIFKSRASTKSGVKRQTSSAALNEEEPSDVICITIPENVQKEIKVVVGEDLTIDSPWKTIAKKDLVDNLHLLKLSHPLKHKRLIEIFPHKELIIGYDAASDKEGEYYITATDNGRTQVLRQLKLMDLDLKERVAKYMKRPAGKWKSLGSEEEILPQCIFLNRPPIRFEWVGEIEPRLKDVKFEPSDPVNMKGAYTRILSKSKDISLVERVVQHTGAQATPAFIESSVQTEPEISINASTQFSPESLIPENINISPEDKLKIDKLFSTYTPKLLEAIGYNELFDLYKDDYTELYEKGEPLHISIFQNYRHYDSLTDLSMHEGLLITAMCWHPTLTGILAAAYGFNYSSKKIKLETEDDREVKNELVITCMGDRSDSELKKWTAQVKHIENVMHSREFSEKEWEAGEATLDAISQAKKLRSFQVLLQKQSESEITDPTNSFIEYDMFYLPYGTEYDIERPILKSIIQYGSDVVNQMVKIKTERDLQKEEKLTEVKEDDIDKVSTKEGEELQEVSTIEPDTETLTSRVSGLILKSESSSSSSQTLNKTDVSQVSAQEEVGEEESKVAEEENEEIDLPQTIRTSDKYRHAGRLSNETLLEMLSKKKEKGAEFTISAILPIKVKPKAPNEEDEKPQEQEDNDTLAITSKAASTYEEVGGLNTDKSKIRDISLLSQKEAREQLRFQKMPHKSKFESVIVTPEKTDSFTLSLTESDYSQIIESEEKDFEDIWGKEEVWYYGPHLREIALHLFRLHKDAAFENEGPMPLTKRLKIPKPKLPQLPFVIADAKEKERDKKKSTEVDPLKVSSKVSMKSQINNVPESLSRITATESRVLVEHRPSEKKSMEGSGNLKMEAPTSKLRQSKMQMSNFTPGLIENLPDIEEPKFHVLNEITEEINEEEFFFKAIPPECSYSYPVLIWSLSDTIVPRLRLYSPFEIVTLSFCPHDGNIIVGGTTLGQVVLWDITGKIEAFAPEKSTNTNSAASFVESVHIIESLLCWRRSRKSFKQIPPTAITSNTDSHFGRIVDLTWVHPGKRINKHGEYEFIEEGEPYTLQFITVSDDNVLKVWDLNTKPKPPPQLRYPDKAFIKHDRLRKGKDAIDLPSEYACLDRVWAPYFEMEIKMDNIFYFTNFEFVHENYNYIPNYIPLKGHLDQIEDIIPYKMVINRDALEDLTKGGFFGTLKGDIGCVTWEGRPTGTAEGLDFQMFPPYHDGPITCISRHELFPHILLSTGGHVFAIWNLNYQESPIKWKRYRDVELTCCGWSNYPSMFRIARSDGIMEVWDLTFQSHKPLPLQASAGKTITEMMNTHLPTPKPLIVMADLTSSIRIFTFEDDELAGRNGFAEMEAMVNIQPERLKKLKEWGIKWCTEHMNRKQRANIKGYNQEVEVFIEQELGDSLLMQKKDARPAESACDRYKEQVYQWYLRRRGNQCVWLDEVERRWYLQEESYMKQRVLENKKWDEKKMETVMRPLEVKEKREQMRKQRVQEMLNQADEIFKAAVADILVKKDIDKKASRISVRVTEEKGFDDQSAVEETQLLFGFHYEKFEKETMEEVKKYPIKDKKMLDVISKYRQVRNIFNDSRRFRDPKLRWLRTTLKQLVEKNGFELVEWESRIQKLMKWEKYERRFQDIDHLKSMYGPNYNPLWDKNKRIQNFEKRMASCGIIMPYKVPKKKKLKGGLPLNSIIKGTEISLLEKSSIDSLSISKSITEVAMEEEEREEIFVEEESITKLDIVTDKTRTASKESEEGSIIGRLPEIPKKVKFLPSDELEVGSGVLPLPDIIPHEEASRTSITESRDPLQKWDDEEVQYSSDIYLSNLLTQEVDSSESSSEEEFEPDIVTMEAYKDVDEIVDKISSMYAMLKPNVNIEVDLHKIKWEPTEEYLVSDEEIEEKSDVEEVVEVTEVKEEPEPAGKKPTIPVEEIEEEFLDVIEQPSDDFIFTEEEIE